MTEKKTFKNQRVAWQYEPLMRKYGWCVEDEPCFFADEWDMEVTFTKKAPVFQKGDRVAFTEYGFRDEYTVEHQRDSHVWVFDDDGDFEVMNAEELTKI